MDDVVIVGCGSSDAEAQSDNQQKLAVTLKRCAEKNIILNEDKQETGLDEIIFHGHRITKDGVKVDEAKVQAIRDMPAPTDVEGVKRLCGMAQYMAKFLPNLAEALEPIRPLWPWTIWSVCLWSCSNSTELPQTSCCYTTQAAEHGSKASSRHHDAL